jgi:hypothetical protein
VATRLFAVVVVSLGHLALLWLVIGAPGWPQARPRSEPPRVEVPAPAETPAVDHDGQPQRPWSLRLPARSVVERPADAPDDPALAELDLESLSPELREARAAGRDYDRRRLAAADRLRRLMYDDDIADAMQLPMPETWRALETLALEGDRVAGDALLDLSSSCNVTGDVRPVYTRLSKSWTRGVAPSDAAFIDTALEAEAEYVQARSDQCRAHGLGRDRLLDMLARVGVPPPAQRGEEISEFHEHFGGGSIDDVTVLSPVHDVMRRLHDARQAPLADDLERLIAASAADAIALEMLARCYISGCAHVPRQPADQCLPTSLRAAAAGSTPALSDVITYLRERNQLIEAHAWARFGQWLAAHACGFFPLVGGYMAASITLAEIGARLRDHERTAAEARARELIAAHGGAARAAQHCTD